MDLNKQPRKVLIYAPYLGNGGVRRLALRLLQTWLQTTDPQQWNFRVLSQPRDGSGEEIPWPADLFTPVDGMRLADQLPENLCPYLQDNQDHFFRVLRREAAGVDVIWLPQPWWTLRLKQEVVDLPAHIIPTVHDFAFDELGWDGTFGDNFRNEARAFVQASSQLIFSSACMKQRAIERYGLHPDDGQVIHLADFVPENFNPTVEEGTRVCQLYDLPKQYWLAFHAIGHKDPLTIIKAIATIKQRNPQHFIPLVMAGVNTDKMRPNSPPGDSYSDMVKECIGELGLVYERDFKILGFVPDSDIAGLYRAATGCIAASRSEAGLNGSIFEAQRARTPLIYSDIAPFVERLGTQGQFGLHFQCGDSQDLARAMLEHLSDAAACQRRATAAFDEFCCRT
ncbi:MAG: glycosyltransferase, partial [Aureliella sp.]